MYDYYVVLGNDCIVRGCVLVFFCFFFFKQKTAYEMRISDWSSDVCSSDLAILRHAREVGAQLVVAGGYGHSRMRQLVFGGVTRHLFEQADVPVLFSH